METENLKMLFDFMREAGGSIGPLAWTWLLLDQIVSPVTWLLTFSTTILVTYRILNRYFLRFLQDDFFKDMRNLLNIGTPGPLYDRERKDVMERLKELAEADAATRRK